MVKGIIYGVRPVSVGKNKTRYILKTEDNQFYSVLLDTVEQPTELLGSEITVSKAEPASDRHVRLVTDPLVLKGQKNSAIRAATIEAMLEQLSPASTPLADRDSIVDTEL